MPSFTELTTAEFFLMGLNMLGACFALVVTMEARRRLAARVSLPRAVEGSDEESYMPLTEITLHAIKDAEIPPMPADVIPLLPVEDPERLKTHI
jgi:hypothetical protein